MPEVLVRPIPVEHARPIRQAILRPTEPFEATFYPLDEAPDSGHFGAFLDGKLVGVTSVYREPMPGEEDLGAWRLRGVAVLEEARRHGCGRLLSQACLEHVAARGGSLLWCNARTGVLPFYQALGFQTRGEEFDVPVSGPHYLVWQHVVANEGI